MKPTRPARVIAPLALLAALAGSVASSVAVAAPSFTLIGYPSTPPFSGSRAYALSADGRSAAGYTVGIGTPGFHWTADGGRNDFGRTSPSPSEGLGISGNGTFVVGGNNSVNNLAFRWSEAGGYQSLGTLPGYTTSKATDANHDGSIVVGTVHNGSGTGTQAFRWTQSGGMQGLGVGTRANAISGNGNVIVGELGSTPQGFTWTQAGGMQFLSPLTGEGGAYAFATNFTGDIVVGLSSAAFRPTIWVAGVPTELLSADINTRITPYGLSDDGTVVAGQLRDTQGREFAGIWTASTGAIRLTDYLTSNGVVLPDGIGLATCTATSSDGLTFVGYTDNGPFGIQGWVATAPAPSATLALGIAGLLASRRRR